MMSATPRKEPLVITCLACTTIVATKPTISEGSCSELCRNCREPTKTMVLVVEGRREGTGSMAVAACCMLTCLERSSKSNIAHGEGGDSDAFGRMII